jgi:hypothetical protein
VAVEARADENLLKLAVWVAIFPADRAVTGFGTLSSGAVTSVPTVVQAESVAWAK